MTAATAQKWARAAGILFLLSMFGGFFGEVYIPSHFIVRGDAAATAANITASPTLFRAGFAVYLIEGICDIALSLVFYVLLRPVNRYLALLAAFFGLVSTAVFAVAELFYFSTSFILGPDSLQAFSPAQRNEIALLSLRAYNAGAGAFMAFYGLASLIRGLLVYRSRYLPKFLGVLWMLAGLGFIARNFVLVLAPAYASPLFLAPMFFAGLALTVWFLFKGIDAAKWDHSAEVPDQHRVA